MMGSSHAVSGVAAWVALTSTAPAALGLHPLGTGQVIAGAILCGGAALLPDLDHPSATAARSGGVVTQVASEVASTVSGGHRKGLHSILAVAGFGLLAYLAPRWVWDAPLLGQIPLGTALLTLFLLVLAGLALGRSGSSKAAIWVAGTGVVVAGLYLVPHWFAMLPLVVVVGVVAHLVGDLVTTQGIPLAWPIVIRPKVDTPLWRKSGNVALPILGNAGSAREWIVTAALGLYVGLVAFQALSAA